MISSKPRHDLCHGGAFCVGAMAAGRMHRGELLYQCALSWKAHNRPTVQHAQSRPTMQPRCDMLQPVTGGPGETVLHHTKRGEASHGGLTFQ